jgi:hypothetical protein
MLFLLTPETADVDVTRASVLLRAAQREWDDVPVSPIGPGALLGCDPGPGDGVLFFNPPRADLSEEVEALLERASAAGAVLLPVALEVDHRRPPDAAGAQQSFDVVDHLRRRELQDDQLGVVGAALARETLSMLMPTFLQRRLRLFLCHRRADGEGSTAALDKALSVRHEHVFRDLIDVQTGEEAQQRIDDALSGADVLVFLDTPLAGESWWVQHELATALGRSIPVVWVRLGPSEGRIELAVRPGAEPHLQVEAAELSAADAGEIADEILRLAARLSRAHARTSLQALHSLKRWAAKQEASVEVLDARQRIFRLRYPPPAEHAGSRRYPMRSAVDVVQFFGRALTVEDKGELERFLIERGMGPHDHDCRAFDAAILLDPTASGHRSVGEWSVAEHPEGFLGTLATAPAPAEGAPSPQLLLLGAFPHGDYARDEVAPAVQAFAATWFTLGGTILSGGHPTFVPLLVEAARLFAGGVRDRLIVFQSAWFAAPAQLEELATQASVVATAREVDRNASLTTMRRRMIEEGGASLAVAIGGRTDEGGAHVPGIEEEIRMARLNGLPVYLLGAAGGQAALIASRESAASVPFGNLGNALTSEQNDWLRETVEYEEAARVIWDAHVPRPSP